MGNLGVDFCGIHFQNPFIIAASPSSDSTDKAERALKAGWAGVVFKTVSTKAHVPKLPEPNMAGVYLAGKRAVGLYNIDLISERCAEEVAADIRQLKAKYPERVFIASIMASSGKEWEELAVQMEDAGADMLECSMSCPQGEASVAGKEKAASQVIPATDSRLMKQTTEIIKRAVKKTPVYVKLTPNVTDIVEVAKGALTGGADALCAVDTVRGFLGVDVETRKPKLSVDGYSTWGGLSGPLIKPIALGCVSRLATACKAPIAGVGGISSWKDAVEFMLLGASVVQVCSAVAEKGFEMISVLCAGLEDYTKRHGDVSVQEIVGNSLGYLTEHPALSREYREVCSVREEVCVRCGRCVTACRDVGFGALSRGEGEAPVVNRQTCRGCGICQSVCAKEALTFIPV